MERAVDGTGPTPLDDKHLEELLELAFDFVCSRPLRDVVDPERALATLDAALAPARVVEFQSRVATPLRDRLLARAARSTLKLGAWLPADVVESLGDILGAPARIPQKMIDDFVASAEVREAVRAMLQESISSFITKATSSEGGGATAGLRGAFGIGARAVGAAGKTLFGGVGDEIQRRLQEKVRDFVDGTVATMQSRIAEKLASEETARSLGARRKKAFLKLLRWTEAEAAKEIAKTPFAKLDALAPKVVAHNLARAELRKAIEEEVREVLHALGDETVGRLLDEAGLRVLARAAFHDLGMPLGRAFTTSPGFEAWRNRAGWGGVPAA